MRRCAAVIVTMALIGAGGCADEGPGPAPQTEADANTAGRTPAEQSSPATSAGSVADDLAAARAIELPEEVPAVYFTDPDAVFAATGSGSYTETLSAAITDAGGNPVYTVELEAIHQEEPRAFHAVGAYTGSNPVSRQTFSMIGLGERFEILRFEDQYWTRTGEDWSGPRPRDRSPMFDDIAPARSLAQAFFPDASTEVVGEETVAGLPTVHYRVAGTPIQLTSVWTALTNGFPPADGFPADLSGGFEVWMQDNGLMVRARYDVTAADGSTLRAALDLSSFGEAVSLTPPR